MSRALDAQVAEKVFGLKTQQRRDYDYIQERYVLEFFRERQPGARPQQVGLDGNPAWVEVPHFSSSIEAAFQVIDKMTQTKPTFVLERYPDGTWVCGTGDLDQAGARLKWFDAKTAPEAICLAALMAVGA